jgi:hypothetical protein
VMPNCLKFEHGTFSELCWNGGGILMGYLIFIGISS